MDVPNSAVLIASVDLTLNSQGLSSSPNSVLAAIQSDINVDGFTIAQRSLGLSAFAFAINGGEFSATLQILNQSGQLADDTDILASFTDACNEEGVTINSFAPLQVIGSSGANSGTGAAGNVLSTSGAGNVPGSATTPAAPQGVPQCGDPALTVWKYPTEWLSCMTTKGLTTAGLLAIGLLLGVVLIVMAQRRPTPV